MDAEFSSWLRFFSIVSVLWRLRFQSIFKNRREYFSLMDTGENGCEVLWWLFFFLLLWCSMRMEGSKDLNRFSFYRDF